MNCKSWVNAPIDLLPGWLQTLSRDCRSPMARRPPRDRGRVAVIGLVLLRRFEVVARRHATLEVA